MNINICKLCKRYKEDTEGRANIWMCAKLAFSCPSRVIPKHNRFVFANYQYVTKDSEIPEHCEYKLRHIMIKENEEIDFEIDSKIEYVGDKWINWGISPL